MREYAPTMELPGTAEASRTNLAIPISPVLTEAQVDEVVRRHPAPPGSGLGRAPSRQPPAGLGPKDGLARPSDSSSPVTGAQGPDLGCGRALGIRLGLERGDAARESP